MYEGLIDQEFFESILETLEIIGDPDLMAALRQGIKDVHEAFDMGYIQRDILVPAGYNPYEVIDKGIAFKG
jgi:hypothetical protein